ncbi:rhodanese-like domain-containing protein [Corynebacterium alimapuense]|uniref:Sulfurtransferase n=1 Tax=Corynebacterium alimapuense TaxID=1576874 RepID=A0A3M8KAR9_9CORY|nr:rhodanese-like domain-containing protein [Corynebacterium alimapuense]RNE49644.1 sulfurtransferase [Corynebacterium alimapuense]
MSNTTTITALEPTELMERISANDNLVLIDVRSRAEFESAHIRGAYNVPLSLVAEHAQEFAARLDSNVVLVCQSGTRAAQARERLSTAGLDTASVLLGGTAAYQEAGGDVVYGKHRWQMERQVRMAAGSLVLAGFIGSRTIARPIGYLSAAVGCGLTFSALSDSCAMAQVLSRMPWNRGSVTPTLESTINNISTATGTVKLA